MNNELMVFLFGCEVGALGFYFLMLFIEYLGEKRYIKYIKQESILPSDCARCFITGKVIPADVVDLGLARFTHEFGAWISKEGQRMLREEADNEDAMCDEWEIIWNEWNPNQ